MIDGRIFKLCKLLSEKPDHNWTIQEMAEIVELSRSHFQRIFKINVGISPQAYLHELRLDKACELLETTFLQIKQICVRAGLPDYSHLTRDFKNRYGLTPTEYRKFHWKKIQAEDQLAENDSFRHKIRLFAKE